MFQWEYFLVASLSFGVNCRTLLSPNRVCFTTFGLLFTKQKLKYTCKLANYFKACVCLNRLTYYCKQEENKNLFVYHLIFHGRNSRLELLNYFPKNQDGNPGFLHYFCVLFPLHHVLCCHPIIYGWCNHPNRRVLHKIVTSPKFLYINIIFIFIIVKSVVSSFRYFWILEILYKIFHYVIFNISHRRMTYFWSFEEENFIEGRTKTKDK